MANYCIALQPICDQDLVHVADELLYRSSSTAKNAVIDNPLLATARVSNMAFYEIGIDKLAPNRMIFFNAPTEWILKPELLPPPSPNIVIEVLESVMGNQAIITSLQHIKKLGYKIALDDFVLTEHTEPLLDIADIIKLDILDNEVNYEHIKLYQEKNIQLLAEKVEYYQDYLKFKELGFTLFQGYFYAKPIIKESQYKERNNNKAIIASILGELSKRLPDINIIEQLIRNDPDLYVKILKSSNSSYNKRAVEITSLKQALVILGINQVRGLVTTTLLSNDNPCSKLNIPKSLIRAYMVQYIAITKDKGLADSAFMTGLLSMIDIMLNDSLQNIVCELNINQDIKDAVTIKKGMLGKCLQLVINYENAKLENIDEKNINALNNAYLKSVEKVNENFVIR